VSDSLLRKDFFPKNQVIHLAKFCWKMCSLQLNVWCCC